MTDYVTHEGVETIDGRVERVGGTRRRQVTVPNHEPPNDDIVRVDIAGTTFRAPVSETSDGDLTFTGAYDSPSRARNRNGQNHLDDFLDDPGLESGRTLNVDVVEPGFRYGIRAPGQTATYRSSGQPNSSLADIARNLDS